MTELHYPDRVVLANTPTPLVELPRTSSALGVELLIKRDDLSGLELSGNKVRKLEFLLAEAIAGGADTVITGGGEQSNHCRATAIAAAKLGLRSHLLLRVDDPAKPPAAARGNVLLDRLVGADIEWISRAQWSDRHSVFEARRASLEQEGRNAYVIPEGGSSDVGSWGYVLAAEELASQLSELPAKRTTVVYACGSGGTGAGLVLGAKLFGYSEAGVTLAGVNVCDDRDYFVSAIGRICTDFIGRYADNLPSPITVNPDDIDIVDGYVGIGYAKSRPEELATLAEFARREAIFLDPVYSGKAYFALTQELAKDPSRFGDRVVFLHTGGIFGLFSGAKAIDELATGLGA